MTWTLESVLTEQNWNLDKIKSVPKPLYYVADECWQVQCDCGAIMLGVQRIVDRGYVGIPDEFILSIAGLVEQAVEAQEAQTAFTLEQHLLAYINRRQRLGWPETQLTRLANDIHQSLEKS